MQIIDKERRSVGADVEDVERVSVIVPSSTDAWRHCSGGHAKTESVVAGT